MDTFVVIVGILWIAFWIYWLVSSIGTKRTLRRGSWFRGLGLRLLLTFLIIYFVHSRGLDWLASYQFLAVNAITGSVSVLICALGLGFAFWARINIGRNWGSPMSVKENPDLVTSGPYAYVRHPIYSGVLLAMLGSSIIFGAWWIVLSIISGIYFVYSAIVEEKLLIQQFPDQYPEYRARTKMLIPFIW